MKMLGLLLFSLFIMVGCSGGKELKISVMNPALTDRHNEMVTVAWNAVSEKLQLTEGGAIIVVDSADNQLPYQILYQGNETPVSIIFPVTLKPCETAHYAIKKGMPDSFAIRTFGRYVPERKDDFAWENDRIAFRMYGPALTPENPSNGVDVILKRTEALFLDGMYENDAKGISYHVDHGSGLDCYKVAHTLGGGGIAPFFHDTLWIGGAYSSYKVLDTGALRTSFELAYDSVPFGNKHITQKITVTLDAFSQFNQATVTYDGDFESFELAGGFWLHNEMGNIRSSQDFGYIAYAENASDSPIPVGRTYIGVIFPQGMNNIIQHDAHLLGLADYVKGNTFTYYFGAGWSKWGFDSDEAWFDYVERYTWHVHQPLILNYQ